MNTQAKFGIGRGLVLAGLAFACFTDSAVAQEKYPSRPVEVIVPWGAGGGSDQTARMLAKHLEADLKTSFPVVNVPGAAGVTGTQKLLLSPADGYALAVSGDWFGIIASQTAKWTLDDFVPVAMVINQISGLYVAENSRFKTWADVEKEAQAKPNTIKVLISGYGIIDDIHANILIKKGVKLVTVPFAKPSERYVSILGGHSDLMYEQAGDIKSYLTNKQMRPLLIFAEKRLPEFPDVPTARELGHDIVTSQVRWVYMKAGTDPQRVKVISDALTRMAASAEYQKYLKDEMAAPDSYVSATQARQFLQNTLVGVRKEAASAGMKTK